MQLSDREKITSRTSEKNQRACMYVGRPIQTKAKVKTKLAAVPENSRAGGEGTWRSSSTMQQQQQQEGKSQRENHLANFFFSPSMV